MTMQGHICALSNYNHLTVSLFHDNENLDSNKTSNTFCIEHIYLCQSDLIKSISLKAQRKCNTDEATSGL